MIARQQAIYAKSGVKFEGSPAMVFAQSAKNMAQDAILTMLSAAKQSSGIRFDALQQRMAAGRARTQSFQELGKGLLDITSQATEYTA